MRSTLAAGARLGEGSATSNRNTSELFVGDWWLALIHPPDALG